MFKSLPQNTCFNANRSYDLSGFYVVCTSNIGSQQLLRPTRLPFTTLERAVISELHKFFRPELIGRFDEKLVFKPLSPDTQREIALLAIPEELALCPPNRGERPEGVSPCPSYPELQRPTRDPGLLPPVTAQVTAPERPDERN